MRLALASFGVVSPVLSVVISVFMAGLFIGTQAAGALAGRLSPGRALALYGLAELFIGLGALAVPRLFKAGESWLLQSGASSSSAYLAASALFITLSLLPWCIAMGAGFPLMLRVLKAQGLQSPSFSLLYLANVLGALLGVLATALVLVECLGIQRSLGLAAVCNALLGLAALAWARRSRFPAEPPAKPLAKKALSLGPDELNLFITGFCSMAMELLWTRAFTPVLLTQVYSFAVILAAYLFATASGSWLYRRALRAGQALSQPTLLALLLGSALLPLPLNDPRLAWGPAGALASILPFCLVLGYLTPLLVDRAAGTDPRRASQAYAINILGCILGPLAASYLLLPYFSVKAIFGLLALPLLWLWVRGSGPGLAAAKAGLGLALISASALCWTYERPFSGARSDWQLRRDHTATVISSGQGWDRKMLINGIGITNLSNITKVMAHLPLAQLDHEPKSALAICFGMGTTFRSLMSWGIEGTAVDLVPSVPEAFGYYFDDGPALLRSPRARVVIDDGRRLLAREQKLYDVITVDPPPPVEAAASSLLYSEEFYRLVRLRLAPGGILQQWAPAPEPATLYAMTRALTRSFPHVRMFRSIEDWGYHFLASDQPIRPIAPAALARRMPPAARQDLQEWLDPRAQAWQVFQKLLENELDPDAAAARATASLTDDRPFNEYYLLRRLSAPAR